MATDAYHANLTAVVNLVTTAETVAVTSALAFSGTLNRAIISGHVNVTAGTGTTAVVVRVRQGATTGGTLVGVADTVTLAAGSTASIPISYEDTSGIMEGAAGGQWSITVQQTAATANGTVNSGDILVQIPL